MMKHVDGGVSGQLLVASRSLEKLSSLYYSSLLIDSLHRVRRRKRRGVPVGASLCLDSISRHLLLAHYY